MDNQITTSKKVSDFLTMTEVDGNQMTPLEAYIDKLMDEWFNCFLLLGIPSSMATADTDQVRGTLFPHFLKLVKKWKGFPLSFIPDAIKHHIHHSKESFRRWDINTLFQAVETYHKTPATEKDVPLVAIRIEEKAKLLTEEERKERVLELIKSLTFEEAFKMWEKWWLKDEIGRLCERNKWTFIAVSRWIWKECDSDVQKEIMKEAESNFRTFLASNTMVIGMNPALMTTDQLIVRYRGMKKEEPKSLKMFIKDVTIDMGGQTVFAEKIFKI